MTDVIVVLPGIMGSTLYSGDTPVWEASRGTLIENLRTLFRSIKQLRLPDDLDIDGHPNDGVTARQIMPDYRLPFGLWTFDFGYSKLLDDLNAKFDLNANHARPRKLIEFPYDWRLSNRYNGKQLQLTVEPALDRWRSQGGEFADAKLVFICHSMGGLVARWYIDVLGGASETRSLITIGTPHRGALTALDQLANGIRKGPGPFKLNFTEFGRSLPSLHQLLPQYTCISTEEDWEKTKEEDWAKMTSIPIPDLDSVRVADATRFYEQLNTARGTAKEPGTRNSYDLHPIGGHKQPTVTSATVLLRPRHGGRVVTSHPARGNEEGGDATVPRLSWIPPDIEPNRPGLTYVADNHAGLVHNASTFNQIEGILTAQTVVTKGDLRELSVELPDVLDPRDPEASEAERAGFAVVRASRPASDLADAPIEVEARALDGSVTGQPTRTKGGVASLRLDDPGIYRISVRGAGSQGALTQPIHALVLVWPDETTLGSLDAD